MLALSLTLPLALLAQAAQLPADQAPSEGTLRRADWHARIAPPSGDPGAVVHGVVAGSPTERTGLRAGDRIVTINDRTVTNLDGFSPVFQKLRGGDSVRARVVRGGTDTVEVRFVLDSVPHERIPGTVATYGAIRSERGYLLRTVTSRPERSSGARLPGVLFIPWLSCDEVEKPDPGNDGYAHVLRAVASGAGMVVMRVEKPGVGDGEGPDCRSGGLDDERASHRAGLKALRSMPGVDPNRIYLLGGSIGGALAPLLASEQPEGIAGVIAVAGYSRTWYAHMRRRLALSGSEPAEVNAAMRGFAQFCLSLPASTADAGPAAPPMPAQSRPAVLLLGAALVLLANIGYVRALGISGLAASTAPVADAMRMAVGGAGEKLIAAGIAVCTFGFLNVNLLVTPRLVQSMVADGMFFAPLTRIDPRFRTPTTAIVSSRAGRSC